MPRYDDYKETEILFHYPRLCSFNANKEPSIFLVMKLKPIFFNIIFVLLSKISLNINKEPSMFLVMKLTLIFINIKKLAPMHVYMNTCIRVICCILL